MAGIERVTKTLPAGFDPRKHKAALEKLVARDHGDGFDLQNLDMDAGQAVFVRRASIMNVSAGQEAETFQVNLPKESSKANLGDKVAADLEATYDGFYMTRFEYLLGRATLTRMDDETRRCRGAVAVALGVKPWDVQARPHPDGGFDLELPKTYVPSKHDAKLDEVANVIIGREGWYVTTDPAKLTARIVPSTPPTFPATLPYPFGQTVPTFSLDTSDWARIPLGRVLPDPGEDLGDEFSIDLLAGQHTQIGGLPGSGKSVAINDYIAGCLARGFELAVVDLPSKAVDFLWCKQFCRPGGWGCESLEAAVTTLALVREEGSRRSRILKEHKGAVKYTDLPADLNDTFKPMIVVVDELTALFMPAKEHKSLDKDHPLRVKAQNTNYLKALLEEHIASIAAELRFVGIHLLLASQVASASTGIGPSLRTLLHHKMLMGSKPTDGNRRLVLSDPERVPKVPASVAADAGAGRGTGVAEPEGQPPAVIKSYYATTEALEGWLTGLGVSTTADPEPTPEQVGEHAASLDDGSGADTPSGRPLDPKFGPVETFDSDGRQLFGAAAAAAAGKQVSDQAGPACPDCGKPINPADGSCGCG